MTRSTRSPARRHRRTMTLVAAGFATALGLVPAQLTSAVASPASPPAATATTRIANTAQHTCLDPTVSPNPYDTLAGAPCSGSAAQSFQLRPLIGQPSHTYQLKDVGTKQCIVHFRFGILQGGCPTPWTVQHVGTSVRTYRIVETATLTGPVQACWQVDPAASGQPGPLFSLVKCNGTTEQTFTLAAGL